MIIISYRCGISICVSHIVLGPALAVLELQTSPACTPLTPADVRVPVTVTALSPLELRARVMEGSCFQEGPPMMETPDPSAASVNSVTSRKVEVLVLNWPLTDSSQESRILRSLFRRIKKKKLFSWFGGHTWQYSGITSGGAAGTTWDSGDQTRVGGMQGKCPTCFTRALASVMSFERFLGKGQKFPVFV